MSSAVIGDGLFAADDWSADSLVIPDNLVDHIVHKVFGRIDNATNLLEDHRAFFLEFVSGKVELRTMSASTSKALARCVAGRLGPVVGALATGAGVENAADAFNFAGDLRWVRAGARCL